MEKSNIPRFDVSDYADYCPYFDLKDIIVEHPFWDPTYYEDQFFLND